MFGIFNRLKNWQFRLKARRCYIECTDRLSSESLQDPMLNRELDALEKIAKGESEKAKDVFKILSTRLKKTPRTFKGTLKELVTILFLGFLILVLNRQMVFEHQQIPTGSMRPTFFEMDRLIVSKTAFGINNPFNYKPLFMDTNLFQRGQIVTFTSEDLALSDQDVQYFGFFPGKKRLVKRLMAKGSDRVYFYGGHIWIVDSDDKLHVSSTFLEKPHDYVPFHHFFGHLEQDKRGNITSKHFQKTVFELEKGAWNLWKNANPSKSIQPWGIHNYAMARLLTKNQAQTIVQSTPKVLQEPYYLDIAHHAKTTPSALSYRDAASPFYVHRCLLPLTSEHLNVLRSHLYTARFRVKDQKAYRYDFERFMTGPGVLLHGVPDGLYEFYYGTAYSISEGGQRTPLEKSHPLYHESLVPSLFNCGVDWSNIYQFKESVSCLMPFRYVYFDNGSLKCLDQVIMQRDDPTLTQFIQDELHASELTAQLYPAFIDEGLPTKEKIKLEGLCLGPQEVMLLGDNHAGSGDSRDFGLATYDHLQGSPLWRFWPLSSLKTGIDSPHRGINRYDAIIWGFLALLCLMFDRWRQWRFERALRWVKEHR